MEDFEEILSGIISPAEGTEFDPNIYDDLRAAHTGRVEAGDAKVALLAAELALAQQTITGLQAHNYELLMQIPGKDTTEDIDPDTDSDTDEPPTASNLFFDEKD